VSFVPPRPRENWLDSRVLAQGYAEQDSEAWGAGPSFWHDDQPLGSDGIR
jgi:hypothetical protein